MPVDRGDARPTRFAGLGYARTAPGLWRVIDESTLCEVGPQYASKAELLADLPRYAAQFGAPDRGPTAFAAALRRARA